MCGGEARADLGTYAVCSPLRTAPAPTDTDVAKWLTWKKTRSEVFGLGVVPWSDGWAHPFIFGADASAKQDYLFKVLLRGRHYQHGLGVLPIPGEWKRTKRSEACRRACALKARGPPEERQGTPNKEISSFLACLLGSAEPQVRDRAQAASCEARLASAPKAEAKFLLQDETTPTDGPFSLFGWLPVESAGATASNVQWPAKLSKLAGLARLAELVGLARLARLARLGQARLAMLARLGWAS